MPPRKPPRVAAAPGAQPRLLPSDLPHVRQIFGDEAIALAPPNPERIPDVLARLLADPDLRETHRQKGFAHIQNLSWEASARAVENAIKDRVRQFAPAEQVH